jgi:hypothetical protein
MPTLAIKLRNKRTASATSRSTPSAYAGVDTLELAVFCEFTDEEKRHAAFEFIADEQRQLRETGNQAKTVFRGEDVLIVRRAGTVTGRGKRGTFYPYRFTWLGADICAANFDRKGERANFTVRLGATNLMAAGGDPLKAWEPVAAFFARFFAADLKRVSVSRCDIFCDLPGVKVSRFFTLFNLGLMVRRTRIKEVEGKGVQDDAGSIRISMSGRSKGWETLWLGKGGQSSVRFYDKLKELHDSKDDFKREQMRVVYWGGHEPKELTRVEFQLRHESLKARKAGTLDQLGRRIFALSEYLSTKWLVVCEKLDRRHTNRKVVHPLWEKLRKAFTERLATGDRARQLPYDMNDADWVNLTIDGENFILPLGSSMAIARQGVGCLLTAAARSGFLDDVDAGDDLIEVLCDQVRFICGGQTEKLLELLEEGQERSMQWRVDRAQVVEKAGLEHWLRRHYQPVLESDGGLGDLPDSLPALVVQSEA